MVFFERKVTGDKKAESFTYSCQAALNSDGLITIRGRIRGLKDSDGNDETMLVLSEDETRAVFKLMKTIKNIVPNEDDLPF